MHDTRIKICKDGPAKVVVNSAPVEVPFGTVDQIKPVMNGKLIIASSGIDSSSLNAPHN